MPSASHLRWQDGDSAWTFGREWNVSRDALSSGCCGSQTITGVFMKNEALPGGPQSADNRKGQQPVEVMKLFWHFNKSHVETQCRLQ